MPLLFLWLLAKEERAAQQQGIPPPTAGRELTPTQGTIILSGLEISGRAERAVRVERPREPSEAGAAVEAERDRVGMVRMEGRAERVAARREPRGERAEPAQRTAAQEGVGAAGVAAEARLPTELRAEPAEPGSFVSGGCSK